MIVPLTLGQVAAYCAESLNAQLLQGDAQFSQVNTDTRTLVAGELFVALRGERFDAHEFLAQAAEKGVCGLVVEKFSPDITLPQLVVSDSLLALGQIAAMNRNAFNKPVLAITGSSGKTTVKTMLADILRECGHVHATKGNLNNHIGVPFTLLQLNADHDFAVIEMGASAIGEIGYLCSLARPQVSMINNVMPAHIEGFGSIEGVARAKGEIYEGLAKENTAVINLDDVFSPQWLANIKSKVIRVSLSNTAADCFASNIVYSESSVNFTMHLMEEQFQVQLPALGEHSVRNALMSAAMASAVGATSNAIQRGLAKFLPVGGRMNLQRGLNDVLVIDDSYNANPGSVRAAIDVLAARSGTRILVLGDLAELGEDAAESHAELGRYARTQKIDQLFTLGTLSLQAAKAFSGGENHHFTHRDALVAALIQYTNSNTTILIKGSRSSKMEMVVKALCVCGDNQ